MSSTEQPELAKKAPASSGDANSTCPKKSVEVVQDIDISTIPVPVEPVPYEQSEETALIRKIDWLIMPYLWGYAVLSAVDVRELNWIGIYITPFHCTNQFGCL